MEINWKKNIKNDMWSMFWMCADADKDTRDADKEVLKENVARLIRLSTQKNAGQRGIKDCIDWNCLEHTVMAIVCATTNLALMGEFGDMPETIEEAD